MFNIVKQLFTKISTNSVKEDLSSVSESKDVPPFMSPLVDVIWPQPLSNDTELKTNTITDLVQQYGVSYIFACISLLSNSVRLFKPKIAKKLPNGGIEEIHEADILKYLKKPNNHYGFPTLVEATAISLTLTGNAYWEIIKVKNKTIGFFVLQPQRVTILKDKNGKPAAYEYFLPNGTKIRYNVDDIIHFKVYNIQDDFYGLSPLVAAKLPANILRKVDEFLESYFERGAVFKGVLETEKTLPKPVYDRLASRFKQLYAGASKAFGLPILEGGLKFKPIQAHPKDSQAFESAQHALLTLLAVFHVPPQLLGFKDANHAVLKELRLMYWEDTVLPLISRIEEILNAQKYKFVPKNEQKYDIILDSTGIEALKLNELLKAKIAIGYGALTINELRARLFGLPPREDGDIVLMPLNMAPVGNDWENTPNAPNPKSLLDVETKQTTSEIFKTSLEWELYHNTFKILIENELVDIFTEQFYKTSSYLDKILSVKTDTNIISSRINDIIDGTKTNIYFGIEKIVKEKTRNVYFSILAKLDPELAINASFPEILDKFTTSWSKALVEIIDETTKKQLITEIINVYTNDVDDVVKALNKVFSKLILPVVGQRLKLIANTEATRIINFASFIAHKNAGYTYKVWKCFDVNSSRHRELHNKRIPIDEKFDINGEKGLFPCDPNLSANNVCNCKCRLIYYKEEN